MSIALHRRYGRELVKILDLRHPFFRPRWRRIAVVAVCLAWTVVEFIGGNPLWGTLFAAIGAYCAYEFFVIFDPKNYEDS